MVKTNKLHKSQEKEELTGIGGWLILPIIGLFLTIGMQFLDMMDSFTYYYFEEVSGFILINLILIVLAGITLFCLFKKLKLAKTMGIITYFVFAIVSIFSLAFAEMIGQILWAIYFYKSKRVDNTFVN